MSESVHERTSAPCDFGMGSSIEKTTSVDLISARGPEKAQCDVSISRHESNVVARLRLCTAFCRCSQHYRTFDLLEDSCHGRYSGVYLDGTHLLTIGERVNILLLALTFTYDRYDSDRFDGART